MLRDDTCFSKFVLKCPREVFLFNLSTQLAQIIAYVISEQQSPIKESSRTAMSALFTYSFNQNTTLCFFVVFVCFFPTTD